ncbi:MAG TPA: S8 family serine peptidase, partial [Acidimicrobiales bacterium]|nr:S8 family serine peptidase [Acidimicrobiales bacterium]
GALGGRGLPGTVYAQASPRSLGGTSLFDAIRPVTAEVVAGFASEAGLVRSAASQLQAAGFQVLHISPVTINIAGPPSLYEEVFDTRLVTEEREVIKGGARRDSATFVEAPDTDLPGLIATAGTPLGEVLEGVAIEEPNYPMEIAFAPTRTFWHLRVPGDISAGCNADRAHRGGITGRGVKVVMVDSGWYKHPYFVRRGYKASPTVLGPATANPGADENGHGTGESANAFATAPDIDFTMVKINFVNSIGAFNAAVALSPHIISCSWGSSVQFGPLSAANQALAAAVATAVSNGTIVVFSAGNCHFGFPGQHPDVISAGGVYMDTDGTLRATGYTSGFASNVYPGRNVPDVSGLVGNPPGASYIMLPIQPGCAIDTDRAGGTHPPQDETASDDGWGAFSGTSAAAPQLAGVCALIKQACPRLGPAQVRSILMNTATDVTEGQNCQGNSAGPGFDLATGAGLVDAHKAVLSAKLSCGPVIRPPVVVGPPVILPPQPPQPPRPPAPPGPPVINPPPTGGAGEAAAAQLAAAGWSPEQIAGVLGTQPGGITAEEAAAVQEAILASGDDLGL